MKSTISLTEIKERARCKYEESKKRYAYHSARLEKARKECTPIQNVNLLWTMYYHATVEIGFILGIPDVFDEMKKAVDDEMKKLEKE